jgi:hypothetical protein
MCLRERTNKGQDIRRITHFEDGRDRSTPSPANKGWKGKTQNIRRQIERGQIVIASNRLMCGFSNPPADVGDPAAAIPECGIKRLWYYISYVSTHAHIVSNCISTMRPANPRTDLFKIESFAKGNLDEQPKFPDAKRGDGNQGRRSL